MVQLVALQQQREKRLAAENMILHLLSMWNQTKTMERSWQP